MRSLFLLLMMVVIEACIQAQPYVDLKSASSSLKKSYQKALKLYQTNNYTEAIDAFQKIIKKNAHFIDANLMLGSIHYDQGNFIQAEAYFQKVVELNPVYLNKIYYTLALTNYENFHFDSAYHNILRYLSREKDNQELILKSQKLAKTFRFADSCYKHPSTFEPIPIQEVNSDFSEYLPSLTADGNTMVFTRKINNDNEDLFISYRATNGSWSNPQSLDDINTLHNEGSPSISPDGQSLIFVSCDRPNSFGGCDLYLSNYHQGHWSIPVNMGDVINTPAYETQPCLTDNGKVLIFTSNRVGGYGGLDLWMTTKNSKNHWTNPVNLGNKVNSTGNEQCPFLHQDGKTLFFNSDGHLGIGQQDLFYCKLVGNKNIWSEPVNLGYPINTPKKESSLIVTYDGHKAIMASDRSFMKEQNQKKLKYINIDLYEFELPEFLRPKKSCYISFEVLDNQSNKHIPAHIELLGINNNQIFYNGLIKEGRNNLISLPGSVDYAINISHPGYILISDQFKCETGTPFNPEKKIWYLQAIESDKSFILRNVFFNTNSYLLLPESEFELNHLVELLQNNNLYHILITGHTDNIGADQENIALSQKRAKAVENYLIQKGVDASRISSQGLGEAKPIATNDTEEGRQQNRRTEFTLIKK